MEKLLQLVVVTALRFYGTILQIGKPNGQLFLAEQPDFASYVGMIAFTLHLTFIQELEQS